MSAAVDRDVATPWLLALRPLWEAIRRSFGPFGAHQLLVCGATSKRTITKAGSAILDHIMSGTTDHQYVSLRKLFFQSANKLVDGRVRLLGMTVAALERVRGWSRAEMRAALTDLERRVRPELVRVAAEMASHGRPLFASSSGRRPVPTLPAAQRSDWFDENGCPIELPSSPSTREGAHRRCSKERDCDRDGARQTEQQQVVFHALRTVITGELPATECDLLVHRVLEFVANMKTVPAGKETSYAALQKTVRGVASSAPRSVEILEGAHVFYGTRRHLARANPNAEEGPDASLRVLVLDPDELEHLSAALTQARWGPEDEPTATGEDFRQRFLDAYLGGWLAAAAATTLDRGGSRSTGPNNVLILLRLLSGNRERQVEASDTGARAEKSVEKQLEDACQLDRIELILAALRRHEGVSVVTVVEEGEENGESELQPLLERVSPVTLFSSADFVARNTLRCARLRRLGDPALRRGGERGWWALEGLGVLTRSPPQEDAAFPSWLVVAGVEAADQEARVKKLLHYHRSFMEAEAQATVFIDGGLSLELQFLRRRRSGGSLRSPGFELARGAFLAVLEALVSNLYDMPSVFSTDAETDNRTGCSSVPLPVRREVRKLATPSCSVAALATWLSAAVRGEGTAARAREDSGDDVGSAEVPARINAQSVLRGGGAGAAKFSTSRDCSSSEVSMEGSERASGCSSDVVESFEHVMAIFDAWVELLNQIARLEVLAGARNPCSHAGSCLLQEETT